MESVMSALEEWIVAATQAKGKDAESLTEKLHFLVQTDHRMFTRHGTLSVRSASEEREDSRRHCHQLIINPVCYYM